MKIDYMYFTNGSVPLFTISEMKKRYAPCDIDFGKNVSFVSFSCAIVVIAKMHHRFINLRANNVSFQTAIVKVLHVPCIVHEPLARGSVNYERRTHLPITA